jgi:hypothetical protein
MKSSWSLTLLCGLTACLATVTGSARPYEDIAVNARVFNNYTRKKLPDGTLKPERYAFADGGRWDVGRVDKSIDALSFTQIAETIAGPLRTQNYLQATDPEQTDLFIMVFWGTTAGAAGGEYGNTNSAVFDGIRNVAAAPPRPDEDVHSDANLLSRIASDGLETALMVNRSENQVRDQNNVTNARILGYMEAYQNALELGEVGFTMSRDVIQELEASRYFVVLKAYDFRVAWKEKKRKILWEARFSIVERGNKFNEQLLAMTQSAARHFGRSTHGLVRQNLPEGKVQTGTPTVVEPTTDANAGGKR